MRDFAIPTMLARLGLRSGKSRPCSWATSTGAAEVLVRGKAHCQDRLPLTAEAGEAIAGYLRDGRPGSRARV